MTGRVRFLDLAQRHAATAEAVEAGVLAVLRSGRYVGGPVVDQAERAVAGLLGRAHGVGVNSGTDALILGLQALGVGPGDEVIVPAVGFFATAEAVVRVGAVPVIADVLPDRPLLDPDAARAVMSPRVRAVVPVHLFGDAAPHPDLGVPVLDDVAQAAGADPPVGRGALAALSFYPTKVLGAAGDGGLVATDDADLAARVRALGSHGLDGPHLHRAVGGALGPNSRLDAVQAAVLVGHLPQLAGRIARRRGIAARYDAALGGLALPRDAGSPVSLYCVRHPRRDALAAALDAAGIDTAVYYPRPVSAQPALQGRARGADPARTPHAAAFCREVLSLPCHSGMSDADAERVVAAVRGAA